MSRMKLKSRAHVSINGIAAVGVAVLAAMVAFADTTRAPELANRAALQQAAGQSVTLLPDGRWLLAGGNARGHVTGAIYLRDPNAASGTADALASVALIHARSGHTATVLPDGRLFVFGGVGGDGALVSTAEIVDLSNGTVESAPGATLIARTGHTTTVLTDGRVLVASGVTADGHVVESAQTWDPSSASTEAASTLQLDEVTRIATAVPLAAEPPALAQTLPLANAADAAIDRPIAIRFNKAVPIAQIDAETVTVVGPSGAVAGRVVGVERGTLAFFTPAADLLPDTTYTVFVRGITDSAGAPLPFSSFKFTTRRIAAGTRNGSGYIDIKVTPANGDADSTGAATGSSTTKAASESRKVAARKNAKKNEQPRKEATDDSEDWTPREQNRRGHWRVLGLPGDPPLAASALALAPAARLSAPAGTTAITGNVVRLNGKPLAGVRVSVGNRAALTDASGRFMLTGVPEGTQQLKVDGTVVQSAGRHYTKHFLEVKVVAGQTAAIPATIYLPRVDPASEVSISSPADREIVLTHPAIPGLEVRIPKGAVLREYDGKIVDKLSITPVPVDRAPYPTPNNFSVYFTLQPGGAFVDGDPTKAVKIVYPNYVGLAAGSRVDFWNYDPAGGGWRVYGHGSVSADGKKITPDADVGFSQIMTFGYAIGPSSSPPPAGPPPGGCTVAADPVDCATGLFLHTETDLVVDDVVPLVVTRTYRQNDNVSRAFGIGMNLSYSYTLYAATSSATPSEVFLVLPDGGRVRYTLQGGSPVTWKNLDSPTRFAGSVLQQGTDTSGNVYTVTLSDRTLMTFMPHSPNQLIGIQDVNGNTTSITVTGDRITQVTSPNGRYILFGYDGANRITSATDHTGRSISYAYDALGRLESATDAANQTEHYTYDTSNRMLTVVDKRGITTVTSVYDTNGRVQQQTLADGAVWQFAYGTITGGTTTTITDPRGYVRQDTFNAKGYLTQQIWAMGQPEQQTYVITRDSTNQIRAVLDPLGRTSQYTFDTNGNVTLARRLAGTAETVAYSYLYDSTWGRLSRITDPLNHSRVLGYDSSGNLASITDALNHATTIVSNAQGLPTTVTNALTHATQIAYVQGDLSSVTDAGGRRRDFFSDSLGRLRTASDGLGNSTLYTYDVRDRVTETTDPSGQTTTYTYDANGNVLTVTDPRGVTHTYTYDSRNRRHTYVDPAGLTETANYDGLDNLTSVVDRKGQTTSFTYDPLNRLKTVTYGDGSTLTITWDAGNRPRVFADTVNGTITRDYDGLDRITQESGPQGTVGYVYDTAGRRTQMTVTGQPTVTYQYDNADRLTQIAQGTKIVGLSYDNANRRTGVTLPGGIIGTFGFDNSGLLTSITYAGASQAANAVYTYDAAGRRISASGTLVRPIDDAALAGASYDTANRLTALTGTTFSYDNEGSLTTLTNSSTSSYTWNARGQLVGTSRGTSLAYDALGRLVSKTVSGVTTTYLYDGNNQVKVNSDLQLRGPGLDELYAQISGGSAISYLTDALGSAVMLTNDSATVVAQYSYGPYGATSATGSADTPFKYAGADYNATDDLYYLRSRYYSPSAQRFIGEDPIGVLGGMNLYAYGGGNPVSFVDSLGLAPGDPYPSRDAAGVAAVCDIIAQSIRENREYAGSVYKRADGKYTYTAPAGRKGTEESSSPAEALPPGDIVPVAWYHTHGAYNPKYGAGNYRHSPEDKDFSDATGKSNYLGDPAKRVRRYDPDPARNRQGKVKELGKCICTK